MIRRRLRGLARGLIQQADRRAHIGRIVPFMDMPEHNLQQFARFAMSILRQLQACQAGGGAQVLHPAPPYDRTRGIHQCVGQRQVMFNRAGRSNHITRGLPGLARESSQPQDTRQLRQARGVMVELVGIAMPPFEVTAR